MSGGEEFVGAVERIVIRVTIESGKIEGFEIGGVAVGNGRTTFGESLKIGIEASNSAVSSLLGISLGESFKI